LRKKDILDLWYQHCCVGPKAASEPLLRIRILQKPPTSSIDGIRLDRFEPGFLYEVGNTLGALLLAEKWAEPLADDEPALLVPLSQAEAFSGRVSELAPSNLVREVIPPYFDHLDTARDLERRKRSRRRARSTIAGVVSHAPASQRARNQRRNS
jgi:hypothetical protein